MAMHLFLGQQAELRAQRYLQRQGLTLITKNYRCRYGEIDLIMYDQQTLVFIEVRFRRKPLYGTPQETVTLKKQQRLQKTALQYLLSHRQHQLAAARFDVVAINKQLPIDWIKNAFVIQHGY